MAVMILGFACFCGWGQSRCWWGSHTGMHFQGVKRLLMMTMGYMVGVSGWGIWIGMDGMDGGMGGITGWAARSKSA